MPGGFQSESSFLTLMYGQEGREPSAKSEKQRSNEIPGLIKITFPSRGGGGSVVVLQNKAAPGKRKHVITKDQSYFP